MPNLSAISFSFSSLALDSDNDLVYAIYSADAIYLATVPTFTESWRALSNFILF